jgi:hypothetical protein
MKVKTNIKAGACTLEDGCTGCSNVRALMECLQPRQDGVKDL